MSKDFKKVLVQYIKEAGQEVIDRAEEMVNSDMTTCFSIHIEFDPEFASIPTISWTNEVLCKNTLDRITEGGK